MSALCADPCCAPASRPFSSSARPLRTASRLLLIGQRRGREEGVPWSGRSSMSKRSSARARQLGESRGRLDGRDGLGLTSRFGLGLANLLRGGPAQLLHAPEHPVAALERLLRMHRGHVGARRLDHAGEGGRLGEGELRRVLAEVGPGGGPEAEHLRRPALAPVDLVEVGLEDPLLAEARLDHDRDPGLLGLAHQRALARQVEVLDELLGDRAAALQLAAAQVDPQGAGDARGRDAG